MKIFFASSSEFYSKNPKEFARIKDTITKLNSGDVFSITDRKINVSGKSNTMSIIHEGDRIIKDSDIVVAVMDHASAGLGYDISRCMSLRKPILLLATSKRKDIQSPHPLRLDSRLLTHKSYTSENLTKIIRDFIKAAKDKLDTKFILIISPEIDSYLEWASDFKRMHKAQIVRNSVEREMHNDQDYIKYMEGAGNRRKSDR